MEDVSRWMICRSRGLTSSSIRTTYLSPKPRYKPSTHTNTDKIPEKNLNLISEGWWAFAKCVLCLPTCEGWKFHVGVACTDWMFPSCPAILFNNLDAKWVWQSPAGRDGGELWPWHGELQSNSPVLCHHPHHVISNSQDILRFRLKIKEYLKLPHWTLPAWSASAIFCEWDDDVLCSHWLLDCLPVGLSIDVEYYQQSSPSQACRFTLLSIGNCFCFFLSVIEKDRIDK